MLDAGLETAKDIWKAGTVFDKVSSVFTQVSLSEGERERACGCLCMCVLCVCLYVYPLELEQGSIGVLGESFIVSL